MQRSPRDSRHPPACSCLVEAFRKFPAQTDIGQGCATPGCPVRSLDSTTLRQFLEAIGGPDGAADEALWSGERRDFRFFRDLARRRRRRKTGCPPE
jgi:hypothetical protein